MADGTKIEWTDATVNFWWGCTKVGPGCDRCYAETFDKRVGGAHWGRGAPRRKIRSAVGLIQRLNAAPVVGRRKRVFVQSMSDLFDLEVPLPWFLEAWAEVEAVGNLDLQIVTKRISAVEKRLVEAERGPRSGWPKHAGLIVTVVNQFEADRDLPRLRALKEWRGIPWVGLSVEPMLGPIDLSPWLDDIDWVICGGESGPGARPMHPDWARSLRDHCAAASVPFLFKQWGEWASVSEAEGPGEHFSFPDHATMRRVGKKAAGRTLEGVTHDGFPVVQP